MILDPNGMPILQPTVDNAETATFNDAFAAVGNTRQIKTYKWADNAARTAQTGMGAGDEGYQTDTGAAYRYDGTVWVALSYGNTIIPTLPVNCSVDAAGVVTVAGQSSFSFDYGSGWDEVEIECINFSGGGGAGDPVLQLRNSGGTNLTTGYSSQGMSQVGTAAPTGQQGTASSWIIGRIGTGAGRVRIILAGGATTGAKSFEATTFDSDSIARWLQGRNASTSVHTGVTIVTGPAMSGRFRVTGRLAS